MQTIAAGMELQELLHLAYRADQPVLLHGRHGVGKSAMLKEAASHLDIGLVVRDLSLMEPPDLIGIPQVGQDGRTHYAHPAFLPANGRGFLVFEELNRCPRYMAAPCLQLLSARQLNDYNLPTGWLPCAAINDADDGYLVEEIDIALLSRFLQVRVVPDVTQWVRWARAQGLHEQLIAFVDQSPGVFNDPTANPRAWTYASRLLHVWEAEARDPALLAVVLAGVLGETWALAFLQVYRGTQQPLEPDAIIDSYPEHRALVHIWKRDGALDVIAASVERLKRHLQPQSVFDAIRQDETAKDHLEAFFADLPADLQRDVQRWLDERGFTGLALPTQACKRRRRVRS